MPGSRPSDQPRSHPGPLRQRHPRPGDGESKLEIDRRRIRERITLLRRELDELEKAMEIFCVCLRLAALEKLPETDRSVIRAYIQLMGASALRLTEIACEQ